MINKLNTAIFYTCGVCNLQCRYCGIDKNPVLKEIDKALEKSFEGDYYFNCVKKYFPNRGQLKRIETWGGEPFLKMERIFPLLH
jgi:sulfatase maturation enzyme AslB (radical SAM superfamily)